MVTVFLCHSSVDKFFVRKLADRLRPYVHVWIDEAELRIGDSLMEKIAGAIERADFLVAVLSHESVRSSWVSKELRLAMTTEIRDRNVKVLPIIIDQCEVPSFLTDKLYGDFTEPDAFESSFAKLLESLGVQGVSNARRMEKLAPDTTIPNSETSEPVRADDLASFEDLRFEDIRIVGIDRDRTYRPNRSMMLYHFYFQLSALPPQEWVAVFKAERRFPRHSLWRRAWIEGKYIVIHCPAEEIPAHHLSDLKKDVANCNAKYREHLVRTARRRAIEEQKQLDEKVSIDNALSNLDFS